MNYNTCATLMQDVTNKENGLKSKEGEDIQVTQQTAEGCMPHLYFIYNTYDCLSVLK